MTIALVIAYCIIGIIFGAITEETVNERPEKEWFNACFAGILIWPFGLVFLFFLALYRAAGYKTP